MSQNGLTSPATAAQDPPSAGQVRVRRFRMRIWHKLSAIALVLLIPLTLVTLYAISQRNSSITIANAELDGASLVRRLSNLTLDLVQYRSLSTQAVHGASIPTHRVAAVEKAINGDFARLNQGNSALRQQLNTALRTDGKSQLLPSELASDWNGIKATGPADALNASFTPQLVNNVLALYSYVGDASHLHLDPQLDTYYTSQAILAREPELVNQISQLGDALRAAVQAGDTTATSQLIQATGVLNQQVGLLNDALNRAFDATPANSNDTALRLVAAPLLDEASTAVNTLVGAANTQGTSGSKSGLTTTAVETLTNNALQANTRLWHTLFDHQNRMLHTRINAARTRNMVLLAAIGTGLALIIALTALMARRIARNISRVAEAANELAAGNLNRHAEVTSRDEVGMLATTFNTMADHLQESYTAVEEKVRVRTAELRQRTRSLRLLQGVATAANKAATWNDALAGGLPLICDYMGWPAAHAYTAETDAGETDEDKKGLRTSPVWYTREPWPASGCARAEALVHHVSMMAIRAHVTGRPQGPELLESGAKWDEALPEGWGVVGSVAFPVLVHGGNAGVVEFFTTEVTELDEADITLLAGMVSQLGRVREREITAKAFEAAAEAAEAANRAKGAFLATMSHEIRTPMNAVVGMTELMLDTSLSDEQRMYAETIHGSADSLLRIINDILDFSKFEAGKFELEQAAIDLNTCIEHAFDVVAPRAREKSGVDLAYIISPDLPREITGDGLRLRQVIVNLLSNAVKFTDVGEIVLTAERGVPAALRKAAPPTTSLGTHPTAHADLGSDGAAPGTAGNPEGLFTIHFSVRDTGVGIPAERLPRLFQPFEQLDSSTTRRYGGTGLGLAISRRLVELMGGELWAESSPGQGSVFHFTLTTQAAPAAGTPSVPQEPAALRGKRLLAVDDNSTSRMILARQADSWGMRARTTGSPEEVLTWIRSEDPFDVAILDMQMPRMDGIALGREINRHRPDLPLILLTSLGKPDFRPEESSLFLSYHTKPIKAAQLYATLCQVLIPQEEAPIQQAATKPIPAEEPTPLRILLAEDNSVNQLLALRMLAKLGYSADAVGDGAQALEALRRHPYDAVLMDVHMPVMNGLDASRAIHREWPQDRRPRIVALTASAMREDRDACLAAGMDDYLTKPLGLNSLADALASLEPRGSRPRPVSSAPSAHVLEAPMAHPASVIKPDTLQALVDSLDAASALTLMDAFLNDSPHLIAAIRQGMQDSDAQLVRRAAHTLKSNGRAFGLEQLAALCEELETAASTGNLDQAHRLAREVETCYQPARGALKGEQRRFTRGHGTPGDGS